MAEKTTGRKYAKNDDKEVLPAIYEHCCNTYKAMLQEATSIASTGGTIIVYEGFFTALITQKLRLSVPYYGRIRDLLVDMGCVKQLKRGGGTAPSQWEIITEPTREAFLLAHKIEGPRKESQLGVTNARVSALEKQLSQALGDLRSIQAFLADKYGTEEATDD
jgi:hypothetical protein